MPIRRHALPRLAFVAAGLSAVHLAGIVALLATSDAFFETLVAHPAWARAMSIVMPVVDLGLAGLFAIVARRASGTAPGVEGKLRATLHGVVGSLHFVLVAITWGVTMHAIAGLRSPRLVSFLEPLDLLYVVTPETARLVRALGIASVLTALPFAALLWSHWFLVREKLRAATFVVFDVVLVAAFAFAIARLPLESDPDVRSSLLLVSLRHGITAVFAARAFVRLVPFILDVFQRYDVRTLVAARHLRSEKSGFLAFISFLSVLAVASSTCVLSTVLAVMGGFRGDLERKILGNSAHVVVDVQRGTFEGYEETLRRVRATPGVRAAAPYVQAEVMITSASNFSGALLRGIDPAQASQVNSLERILREDPRKSRGSLELLHDPARIEGLPMRQRCPGARRDGPDVPTDSDAKPRPAPAAADDEPLVGILIGSELARSLRLCVGDDLEVVSPLGDLGPAGPMPKTREFRVAGIFHSGMYEYDMRHVYVLLDIAQSFLRTGDAVTGIEIRGADVEAAPALAASVRRGLGRSDLRVEDWRRRNQSLFGALALEKLLVSFTLGITVLIAGCCVFATITLMVYEKRREVGILKAMGATDRDIVGIFLGEGMLIGVLGATAGLGLGALLCFAVEHFGLRMNAEVIYLDRLPVDANALEFAVVGLAATAISILSTLVPAIHASRLRPVDAVRND